MNPPFSGSTDFDQIDGTIIWQNPSGSYGVDWIGYEWTTGTDIDGDGSPFCYNPQNTGLDDIENAMDGNLFVGVATVGGKGIVPYRQGPGDPNPGGYVSQTSYQNLIYPVSDYRRYLNAQTVNYIVAPGRFIRNVKGIVLGCKAQTTRLSLGITVPTVVGDDGPSDKIGEMSMFNAENLHIPNSPRTGGISDKDVRYVCWPGLVQDGYTLQHFQG